MSRVPDAQRLPWSPFVALLLVSAIVAAVGARPYAGSWNDGSRLATAESLVDLGGWGIDRSIFVVPALTPADAPPPFPPSNQLLSTRGTLDRLFIDGRFVSDKTPVSNLLLAGEYWLLQRLTGIVARTDADRFCYWLTLLTAGLSFGVLTGGMFVLAWRITASVPLAMVIAVSFGFGTCAAAYSRHVNSHIVLLAVFSLLMLTADRSVRDAGKSAVTVGWLGTLGGYAIFSTNHSGVALSVRWFIPLLAPLFYLLAVHLQTAPEDREMFVALTVVGLALGVSAWVGGPWAPRVPFFWWWVALALISGTIAWHRRRRHGVKS